MYTCVEDLHDTDWCVGVKDSSNGWAWRALQWAYNQQDEELVQNVLSYAQNENEEVMSYIAEEWGLKFERE